MQYTLLLLHCAIFRNKYRCKRWVTELFYEDKSVKNAMQKDHSSEVIHFGIFARIRPASLFLGLHKKLFVLKTHHCVIIVCRDGYQKRTPHMLYLKAIFYVCQRGLLLYKYKNAWTIFKLLKQISMRKQKISRNCFSQFLRAYRMF